MMEVLKANMEKIKSSDIIETEGLDEDTFIMSSRHKDIIIQSIEVVTSQRRKKRSMKIVSDYDVENISTKVLRIILSYIDYFKKILWNKGI